MTFQVAAIVLAAGLSTRMAPENKLLLRDAAGVAMVARTVIACLQSQAAQTVIVSGHQAALVKTAVREAVPEAPLEFVYAAEYARGLSASLRVGLDALPNTVNAVLICLGDMPRVGPQVMDRLIGAFEIVAGGMIVVPVFDGRHGNPVLWDACHVGEMCKLSGDQGARVLMKEHPSLVRKVSIDDDSVLMDFDVPNALFRVPGDRRSKL